MDPETEPTPYPTLAPTTPATPDLVPSDIVPSVLAAPASSATLQPDDPFLLPPQPYHGLKWIFIGPDGMRAGWSALIFVSLLVLFIGIFGFIFLKLRLIAGTNKLTPHQQFFSELFQMLGLFSAVALMALIEGRNILDYNLRGSRRVLHFVSGFIVGFAALSTLVGGLAAGHWLRFGPVALSGSQIFTYAVLWGVVFLMVGCFEEGMMRCYLQYTFTRGINFAWATALIACLCCVLVFTQKGNGAWGVYAIALLGLFPCLLLQLKSAPSAGFWNAAWLTSTLFGAMHTGNTGENWIGIFAAAFIGFAFCVSIWVTGSAWWAIGCHAAWDWAESYFYGTADSGMVAQGHLLSTSATGNPLWSGGTDGPEGSLLIIPIVLLLILWLLVVYRRPRRDGTLAPHAAEQIAS
jgi:uncharacterized protein